MAKTGPAPSSESMGGFAFWAPFLILALGLLWRVVLIASGSDLHVDEGNFASVARHVARSGDWMLNGPRTDKPPVTFWLQALTMLVVGPSAAAARSATLIGYAVGAWALLSPLKKAWGAPAAIVGAALWAFSPLGALLGSAAMSDIYVAAFGLACLVCAVCNSPRLAALFLILSFGSKPTGMIYGPLAWALISGENRSSERKVFIRFSVLGLGLLMLHSLLFANPRFGAYYRPGDAAENPVARFHPSLNAWTERLAFWRPVLAQAVGAWARWALGGALVAAFIFGNKRLSVVLGAACLGLGFLFLVVGMPLFERHLLLWWPVLALTASLAWAGRQSRSAWIAALGFALVLGVSTARATWTNALPHWGPRYQGTQGWASLAESLNSQLKRDDAVVLMPSVLEEGWTAGFYLQAEGHSVKLYNSNDGQISKEWKNAAWAVAVEPSATGRRALKAWRLGDDKNVR